MDPIAVTCENRPGAPQALTVTQLARVIRDTVRANPILSRILVRGEVSNLQRAPSGHVFFTLKDATAQISCTLFREDAEMLGFDLEDGMDVVVSGDVDVFPRRGSVQLLIKAATPAGVGAFWAAYQKTRKKLAAEGLFDAARKRPLPSFPRMTGRRLPVPQRSSSPRTQRNSWRGSTARAARWSGKFARRFGGLEDERWPSGNGSPRGACSGGSRRTAHSWNGRSLRYRPSHPARSPASGNGSTRPAGVSMSSAPSRRCSAAMPSRNARTGMLSHTPRTSVRAMPSRSVSRTDGFGFTSIRNRRNHDRRAEL